MRNIPLLNRRYRVSICAGSPFTGHNYPIFTGLRKRGKEDRQRTRSDFAGNFSFSCSPFVIGIFLKFPWKQKLQYSGDFYSPSRGYSPDCSGCCFSALRATANCRSISCRTWTSTILRAGGSSWRGSLKPWPLPVATLAGKANFSRLRALIPSVPSIPRAERASISSLTLTAISTRPRLTCKAQSALPSAVCRLP